VIRWPDGTQQVIDDVAVDRVLAVVEDDTWTDLNLGHPGTGGIEPRLAGLGVAAGGETLGVALRQALPGAQATLVIGGSALEAPFKKVVLVPAADVVLPLGPVGGDGSLEATGTWPAGAPAGVGLWMQAWVADPGASAGFAGSNAIMTTSQ